MLSDSSLYPNSLACSGSWKASVTKSGHLLYRQKLPAHPTEDSGCSLLLPTPKKTDGNRHMNVHPSMFLNRASPEQVYYAGLLHMGHIRFPTPCKSQAGKPIRPLIPSELAGKHGRMLPGMIGDLAPSLIGLRLHPHFVEWMMGFPTDWTLPGSQRSGTQSSLGSFGLYSDASPTSNFQEAPHETD
jgi:hypothetical protein